MLDRMYEASLQHLQSSHSRTFRETWQGYDYAYRVVAPESEPCDRTLLVLGGALRPLKPWPRLESNLPAGTRVVFLELPGLWDSRVTPPLFTWDLLLGAAVQTLDLLAVPTCDVLALSASAPLGYRLVHSHNDRVARLVTVGAIACVTDEVREVLERMSACLISRRDLQSDRSVRKAFTAAYADFFRLSRRSTNKAAATLGAAIMRSLFTEVPFEKFRKCAQFYQDLFLSDAVEIIPEGDRKYADLVDLWRTGRSRASRIRASHCPQFPQLSGGSNERGWAQSPSGVGQRLSRPTDTLLDGPPTARTIVLLFDVNSATLQIAPAGRGKCPC